MAGALWHWYRDDDADVDEHADDDAHEDGHAIAHRHTLVNCCVDWDTHQYRHCSRDVHIIVIVVCIVVAIGDANGLRLRAAIVHFFTVLCGNEVTHGVGLRNEQCVFDGGFDSFEDRLVLQLGISIAVWLGLTDSRCNIVANALGGCDAHAYAYGGCNEECHDHELPFQFDHRCIYWHAFVDGRCNKQFDGCAVGNVNRGVYCSSDGQHDCASDAVEETKCAADAVEDANG